MKLDRENNSQREFEIEIRATDQGNPPLSGKKNEKYKNCTVIVQFLYRTGTGLAIIKVLDVNDNPPYFDPPSYTGNVKETAPINSPIMSLSAKDPDNEAKDNVLHYSLVPNGQSGLQYFYISTDPDNSGSNVGIIRVKQVSKKRTKYERKTLKI